MSLKSITNTTLDKLPKHLKSFVIPQPYDNYTAQDHAIWRFVMRLNKKYLSKVAHDSYINGLKKTGILINAIPQMEGMNGILKEIGWSAVAVDGFIPPNAFMEFQAYNTLVIAADIRTLDHIEYTPAPDIIHEAAGHAPIIANPEYAEYLRRFGEIGCKAISSSKDYELYEAIRHLSIVKENPNTSEEVIKEAEEEVEFISNSMGKPSEMSRIRNLHWWTVEYGLIGSLEHPKIYGAGLLSSIGESKWCMSNKVIKIPYTIAAADVSFDITKPQPKLFVTPDFAHLSFVLEEFANKMALRRGGLKGVKKLIESKNLGTIELSTGIQISGTFNSVIEGENNDTIYIQTNDPTALAYKNKELIGHSKSYHSNGFGSPIGKLKGINLAIENMAPRDLEAYGIYEGKTTILKFEGGVIVEGEIITGMRNLKGRIILISFKNCTVKYKDQLLFKPEWGVYDMAVGASITSAYAGVADPVGFELKFNPPKEKTQKIIHSAKMIKIFDMYDVVRKMRESNSISQKKLENIFLDSKNFAPKDWLLILEIYELIFKTETSLKKQVYLHLQNLKQDKNYANLIDEGLAILN